MENSRPLKLSFDLKDREFGSHVQWLSTAATDGTSTPPTLLPRFFQGNMISNYITNHVYSYVNAQGAEVQQTMTQVNLLEVDKLFIPGASGSPILNSAKNKVIGFVHAFRSWPIITKAEIKQRVNITDSTGSKDVDLTYQVPLTASLSLGVDVRTIKDYLKEQKFLPVKKKIVSK